MPKGPQGSVRAMLALLCAMVLSMVASIVPNVAFAAAWDKGDVFVGVASGRYQVYSNAGVLKETVSTSNGYTTGCAFDAAGNLYGTYFSSSQVFKFNGVDPHTPAPFGSGYATPESIVFDGAGRVYVGNLGNGIRQYQANGTFIKTVINTNVDWFDIAANQDTIFYTQEGRDIKRVSIASGASLPNFTTGTAVTAYALRILPDGGVLLADSVNVKRYNSLGIVTQTYNAPGENSWFALNLDPNGTSFWSGNFNTGRFYRFNIATGAIERGPINTGTGGGTLFGICLKGELTQATQGLELSPLTATNDTGTPHTVTATATRNGQPAPTITVTLTVTGANPTGGACVTNAAGQCTFTYTGTNAGNDTITGTATIDGNLKTATASKTWRSVLVNRSLDLSTNDTAVTPTAFARAPHAAELNLIGDWTTEAWFKEESPTGYDHDWAKIVSKGDPNEAEAPYEVAVGFGNLSAGLRNGFFDYTVTYDLIAHNVSTNAWHHVAASFQSTSTVVTLYLDGVQVAQGVLGANSTGNSIPVSFGSENGAGGFWSGKLDDVRIWNRVRTAGEITANYQTEFGSPQANLVGNWRFNEARGSGTTSADNAAPPHNATLQGGADFSCDTHATPSCSP